MHCATDGTLTIHNVFTDTQTLAQVRDSIMFLGLFDLRDLFSCVLFYTLVYFSFGLTALFVS